MELEELKVGWNVLNERLAQNEILNKRIIKDMITTRTLSAHERLFRFDLFGLILLFGICILFPFLNVALETKGLKPLSMVLLEVVLIVGLVIQIIIFSFLSRFNMDKMKICELSRLVLKYKLWTKRSMTYGLILVVVAIIGVYFIQRAYLLPYVELQLCIILFFASLMTYFQLGFYKKNIRIIEKGLEELKEFEEEEAVLE